MRAALSRRVALQALLAVESGAHAEAALAHRLRGVVMARRDIALTTELVYGTVRRLNSIDHALGSISDRPVSNLPPPIRNILRMGAYQLLYLDRIPGYAAVNDSVALARSYGHSGTVRLVNAVLRRLAASPGLGELPTDTVDRMALELSHPRWLLERWLSRYGQQDTIRLCEWNNQPAPVVVRPNRLRGGLDALVRSLESDGVSWKTAGLLAEPDCGIVIDGFGAVAELDAYRRGLFQVQDEGAMLVSIVAGPVPGQTVLDVCAGPGGKTTHMAELMENHGRILAIDITDERLRMVVGACERLGITIVRVTRGDARDLSRIGGLFDVVLVDAPCSGTGALRRNPDARWTKNAADIGRLSKLQLELVVSASTRVRPGGTLTYATCSLEPEENGDVVSSFLRSYPGFSLQPPESTPVPMPEGFMQLLPHVHGSDGLFMARMTKIR